MNKLTALLPPIKNTLLRRVMYLNAASAALFTLFVLGDLAITQHWIDAIALVLPVVLLLKVYLLYPWGDRIISRYPFLA